MIHEQSLIAEVIVILNTYFSVFDLFLLLSVLLSFISTLAVQLLNKLLQALEAIDKTAFCHD